MVNDLNPPQPPSDPMRYGILGKDASSTEDKLNKYTGNITWDYLRPHFKEGTLLFVDPSLELKTVGKAMADDNKAQIEAWLKSGDVLQPGDLHAQHWEQSSESFVALVISPFVLFQPAHVD